MNMAVKRPMGTPTSMAPAVDVNAAHDHGEYAVDILARLPGGTQQEFGGPNLKYGRKAVREQENADQRHG
jgi:hypothetical protein